MVFQERTYGVLIVSTSDKFIEATRALLPPTDYYPVETAHSAGEAPNKRPPDHYTLCLCGSV